MPQCVGCRPRSLVARLHGMQVEKQERALFARLDERAAWDAHGGAVGLQPATVAKMQRAAGLPSALLVLDDGRTVRADDPIWDRYEAYRAETQRALGATPEGDAAAQEVAKEAGRGIGLALIGEFLVRSAVGAGAGMAVAALTAPKGAPPKYGKGAAIGAGVGLISPIVVGLVKGAVSP